MSQRRAARRAPRAPAVRRPAPARDRSTARRPRTRGRQAEVRTLRARGPEHLVGQEGGILPEDRLLELGKLRARIQSQLGCEQPPRPAYRGERISLPTLTVLRHAKDHPAPLAQRRLGDTGARQRGDLLNLARLQACIQEQLLDPEAQFLQASGRDLRGLLV